MNTDIVKAIREWCETKFQPKGNYITQDSVGNAKITIKQNGEVVGSFTVNQTEDLEINIDGGEAL